MAYAGIRTPSVSRFLLVPLGDSVRLTTLLDVLFIAATTAVLIRGINDQMNIGVATFLGSYLVFALVAHAVWRVTANVDYANDYYLVAHCISLIFVALIVELSKRDTQQNAHLLRTVRGIRPSALTAAFSLWLTFQFYLLAKYGMAVDHTASSGPHSVAYFDFTGLMLINTLASGAALVAIIRLGVDPAFTRNLVPMLMLGAFVLYLLAFGVAWAGGRRTLLILAICFLVTKIIAARQKVGLALRRHLPAAVLASITLLAAAWYYQQVRSNMNLPVVQHAFADGSLSRTLEGVTLLLTPGLSGAYMSTSQFSSGVNRSGPFDFLYSIVEARSQYNRSSDGELTLFSIEKAIPKVFHPTKPEYDVDYLIGANFGVVMGRNFSVDARFFEAPDYSTTVLAMLFADFGWIAVPIAALIAVVGIRMAISVLGLAPASALVAFGALGVLFELTATIEGTLSSVLSALRTLVMVAGVGLLFRIMSLRRSPAVKRWET